MKKIDYEDIKYKLIVIGDENVGKTSILKRFKNNQFTGDYEPTVGLDFQSIPIFVDNISIALLLYDTSGQEKFRSLIPLYTKDANIILLIYDITNNESFTNVEKWYNSLSNINKEEAIFILIGNKIDLKDERKVKEEDGKQYADEHNYLFKEISALTGDGIEDLFLNIIITQIRSHLLYKDKCISEEEEKLKFNLNQDKKQEKTKRKCCDCIK